jgi:hypothetical protein
MDRCNEVGVKLTYDHPLQITMGPKPVSVVRVKHGVTEVFLSNGRLVRISLHIEGVVETTEQLDVNYNTIVEVMTEPKQIMDVHEGLQ